MKSIEEIKNEVAVNNGFVDWRAVMFYHKQSLNTEEFSEIVDQVAYEHAQQCCDEQIRECKEGIILSISNITYRRKAANIVANTPNVVTTK